MAPFIRKRYHYKIVENAAVGLSIGQPTLNTSGQRSPELAFHLANKENANDQVSVEETTGEIKVGKVMGDISCSAYDEVLHFL